jgi:hypothetical protein
MAAIMTSPAVMIVPAVAVMIANASDEASMRRQRAPGILSRQSAREVVPGRLP